MGRLGRAAAKWLRQTWLLIWLVDVFTRSVSSAAWSLAVGLLAVGLTAVFAQDSLFDDWSQKIATVTGSPPARAAGRPDVTVLEIDDAALFTLGPGGDDRVALACLARRALDAGAVTVVVDAAFVAALRPAADPGPAAADLTSVYQNPRVVFGVRVVRPGPVLRELPPDPAVADPALANWGAITLLAGRDTGTVRGLDAIAVGVAFDGTHGPIPSLALAGWAATRPGWTGAELRRRLRPCLAGDRHCDSSLAPLALAAADGQRLNFVDLWAQIERVSASALLDSSGCAAGPLDAALLAGDVVVIGATHAAAGDVRRTPASLPWLPVVGAWAGLPAPDPTHGVHIHALAVANLLDGSFLRPAPLWVQAAVFLAGLAVLPIAWRWRLRPTTAAPGALLLLGWGVAVVLGAIVLPVVLGALLVGTSGLHANLAWIVPGLAALAALDALLLSRRFYGDGIYARRHRIAAATTRRPPWLPDLTGRPIAACGLALHLGWEPDGTTPAGAADDAADRITAHLRAALLPLAEGERTVLIDNWCFNRVTAYVLVDGLAPDAVAAIGDRLLAIADSLRAAARATGPWTVTVRTANGPLVLLDLGGDSEAGVLTFAGPLPDQLVEAPTRAPQPAPLSAASAADQKVQP